MEKVICAYCEGKGERNYGMAAEGVYPDVIEYYKGFNICDQCEGRGHYPTLESEGITEEELNDIGEI